MTSIICKMVIFFNKPNVATLVGLPKLGSAEFCKQFRKEHYTEIAYTEFCNEVMSKIAEM